ncbi:Predicted exporter of the RND superfamily [gamma proteobacterium HdN1]|nr:Predicted exporter of the RND superfamily [gamma proteobacterium HdN1]
MVFMNVDRSQRSATAWIARWLVNHPWLALIAGLAIVAGCAGGLGGYQYSMDHRAFFSADNPQLQGYEQLQTDYSRTDTVLVVLAPKDGKVFQRDFLAVLQKLTQDAWQIPYSQRVESLTNFQHVQVEGDSIETHDLVEDPAALTDAELKHIQSVATHDAFLVNALVNPGASVTGVRITLNLPGKDPRKEVPEVVMPLRELAAKITAAHPDIQVHLVGQTIANQAYPEESQADFTRVWPWFTITLLVVLTWLFRSAKAMLATWIACQLAVVAGAGAAGYWKPVVNDAVIVAPIMILTLALADCIHLVVGWIQAQQRGMDRRAAMEDSLRHNLVAMTITSGLTVIGFLTLHFNDSPPFQVMGYIVAFGVSFALLFTMLITAPMLILLPGKPPKNPLPLQSPDSLAMSRFAGFVIRRRWALLICLLSIGSVLSALSLTNRINDDIVKYYTEETPFRQSMEFVNANLTGTGEINYPVVAGGADQISDPEYLKALDAFSTWLKTQPDVVQVNSIVDIIKRVNQVMHGDDPSYYRIPDRRDEIAQYLLQYELSLPFGMDLNYLIRFDRAASRVRVAVGTSSGQRLIELDQHAQEWQKKHWPAAMQTPGASLSLMFAHIGERSISGMFWGLIGSLALASLFLWMIYRYWVYAVACFVGNLLPVGAAFGVWAMINGNIDLGLTVVLGIAFSVVVDDTVHFINKYDWSRRDGLLPLDAVHRSFMRVGFALITTSVVLGLGFAWLGNSAIQLTVNTAFMICLSIVFALVVDLLVVPPLLAVLDGRNMGNVNNVDGDVH